MRSRRSWLNNRVVKSTQLWAQVVDTKNKLQLPWVPTTRRQMQLSSDRKEKHEGLLFGKHKGKRLDQVPNDYLGWLTMWEVVYHCCDDVANCEDECGGQVKIRCLTKKDCGAGNHCDCSRSCGSLTFLKRQTEVVTAARAETKRRRLCRECWTVMPAVGDNRTNGAGHPDWNERMLHKKCWRELVGWSCAWAFSILCISHLICSKTLSWHVSSCCKYSKYARRFTKYSDSVFILNCVCVKPKQSILTTPRKSWQRIWTHTLNASLRESTGISDLVLQRFLLT